MKQHVNSLSPDSNMRWERTRMMLPEHRTALIEHRNEMLNRRPPQPDLDEQQKENINRALTQSKAYRQQVRVELYHPYEQLQVIGIVEQIDTGTKTFKVDGERFKIGDILNAECDGAE